MTFANLTEQNARLFAIQHYDNVQCLTEDEFNDDYKRFWFVRRLCKLYVHGQFINERLLLNHIILLLNVFGAMATVRLLFLKADREIQGVLKAYLLYLNVLPIVITGVNGKNIHVDEIAEDLGVLERLEAL